MKRMRLTHPKGQNFVEFALIAPILFLLIFIIIDLGRITYSYTAVHNMAREGARYGIINPVNTVEIQDKARTYAVGLDTDASVLRIIPLYNALNETITVTVQYDFKTASPILTLLTGQDMFTLEAVSQMHTEE